MFDAAFFNPIPYNSFNGIKKPNCLKNSIETYKTNDSRCVKPEPYQVFSALYKNNQWVHNKKTKATKYAKWKQMLLDYCNNDKNAIHKELTSIIKQYRLNDRNDIQHSASPVQLPIATQHSTGVQVHDMLNGVKVGSGIVIPLNLHRYDTISSHEHKATQTDFENLLQHDSKSYADKQTQTDFENIIDPFDDNNDHKKPQPKDDGDKFKRHDFKDGSGSEDDSDSDDNHDGKGSRYAKDISNELKQFKKEVMDEIRALPASRVDNQTITNQSNYYGVRRTESEQPQPLDPVQPRVAEPQPLPNPTPIVPDPVAPPQTPFASSSRRPYEAPRRTLIQRALGRPPTFRGFDDDQYTGFMERQSYDIQQLQRQQLELQRQQMQFQQRQLNFDVTQARRQQQPPQANAPIIINNPGVQIPGPQGPVGNMGPEGPIGGQGPVGDQGPGGNMGPEGPIGGQGPVGDQGPAGNMGAEGPIGGQGPVGDQGPAGNMGAEGPIGGQGPVGDQGPAGNMGAEGPIGGQGPIGNQGPVGNMGADGPIGGQGSVGDQGPAGNMGADGPIGGQGPVGDQGPAGNPGADGHPAPIVLDEQFHRDVNAFVTSVRQQSIYSVDTDANRITLNQVMNNGSRLIMLLSHASAEPGQVLGYVHRLLDGTRTLTTNQYNEYLSALNSSVADANDNGIAMVMTHLEWFSAEYRSRFTDSLTGLFNALILHSPTNVNIIDLQIEFQTRQTAIETSEAILRSINTVIQDRRIPPLGQSLNDIYNLIQRHNIDRHAAITVSAQNDLIQSSNLQLVVMNQLRSDINTFNIERDQQSQQQLQNTLQQQQTNLARDFIEIRNQLTTQIDDSISMGRRVLSDLYNTLLLHSHYSLLMRERNAQIIELLTLFQSDDGSVQEAIADALNNQQQGQNTSDLADQGAQQTLQVSIEQTEQGLTSIPPCDTSISPIQPPARPTTAIDRRLDRDRPGGQTVNDMDRRRLDFDRRIPPILRFDENNTPPSPYDENNPPPPPPRRSSVVELPVDDSLTEEASNEMQRFSENTTVIDQGVLDETQRKANLENALVELMTARIETQDQLYRWIDFTLDTIIQDSARIRTEEQFLRSMSNYRTWRDIITTQDFPNENVARWRTLIEPIFENLPEDTTGNQLILVSLRALLLILELLQTRVDSARALHDRNTLASIHEEYNTLLTLNPLPPRETQGSQNFRNEIVDLFHKLDDISRHIIRYTRPQ
jgi:hypothetical protein